METYEEFCLRSLARVSEVSKGCSCTTASSQQELPHSLIRFHGMAALAPLLTEEQRRDMVQYRIRAVELDSRRRNRHREALLTRVRDILDRVQVRKTLKESQTLAPPVGCQPEHQSTNSFFLLPDSSAQPCRVTGVGNIADAVDLQEESTVHLSWSDGGEGSEDCDTQEQKGPDPPGSLGSCRATPVPEESLSDKENENISIRDKSNGDRGSASPLPAPTPQSFPSPTHCQAGPGADNSLDALLGFLPRSLTGSYAQLPNPQPSLSPLPHRRRLRPVSAGNILIANPTNAAELSPPRTRRWAPLGYSPSPQGGNDHSCQSSSRVSPGVSSPCDFTAGSQILDSRLDTSMDQSYERVPRFLGDQPWQPPVRRSPPAPLNKSYDVECPSPTLLRPHVVSDPCPTPTNTHHWNPVGVPMKEQGSTTGELQQQLQEVTNHLSLLKAEPEKEPQQHLLQERSENRPLLTPVRSDKSPEHTTRSTGYTPAVSPHVQPPMYLWATSPGSSKTHSRVTLVVSPKQQRALCRLTALARGFLTRRLLCTEKVKHLHQTVKDTQDFICSFQNDVPGRKAVLSAQDLSLQERVRAQLRAALFSIHDIFFVWGPGERMALLQQDRELRTERKLREMEKARSPRGRVTLSAATQKSLHRKKQRMIDTSGQGRKPPPKPKPKVPAKTSSGPYKRLTAPSAPAVPSRVLQPSQGQNALLPGQLLRQGSLYRKNPEERVKRCHNLRKQHSLG